MTPTISIITPLHNNQDTILETIQSIQNQTRQDWEHLIIDNLSTDKGFEIVQKIAQTDSRLIPLSYTISPNAGLTRNVGIAEARGRYIAFLDADDTWDPKKLEKQLAFMQNNDLAFSWTSYRVNTQNIKQTPGHQTIHMPIRKTTKNATAKDLLNKKAVIGCLTTIYDTQKLGKIFMTDIQQREDFVLFVNLLKMTENNNLKAQGLDDILATYRLSNTSLSSNKAKAALYQWKALRGDLNIPIYEAIPYFFSYTFRGIIDRLKLKKSS